MNKNNTDNIAWGLALANRGDLAGAEVFFNRAISQNDRPSVALLWRGLIYLKTGRYHESEKDLKQSWGLNPREAETAFNLGDLYKEEENYDEALSWYNKALEINKYHAAAWLNKAVVLVALRDFASAEPLLRTFVRKYPNLKEGLINLGNLLILKRAYKEAKLYFIDALKKDARFAFVYLKLAEIEILEENYENAREYLAKIPESSAWGYDRALRTAEILIAEKDYTKAFAVLDNASALRPNSFGTYKALSECFEGAGDLPRSIKALEKAKSISFDRRFPIDKLLTLKSKICDWSTREKDLEDLMKMNYEMDLRKLGTLALMYYLDDPIKIRDYVAKTWINTAPIDPIKIAPNQESKKIVYISPDFKEHPVGYLMKEIISSQVAAGYEIYLVYLEDDYSRMWESFKAIATGYLEAKKISDHKVVQWILSLDPGACVDLAGLTAGTRLSLFMELKGIRTIAYLGYPGTLGFDRITYFIGNDFTIGQQNAEHFTEEILRLPAHYFPVQKERFDHKIIFSREGEKLPENSFVFSSMSHYSKITPETFDCWCKILRDCSESVLWLASGEEVGQNNMRERAQSFGIEASRIRFAERSETVAEHLSRLRCADLMLDTYPYGGHTSASDFLLAQVPLLTRIGKCFHTRIAGDMLNTLQLNDYITESDSEFHRIAVDCYNGSRDLESIRKHLRHKIYEADIFNINRYSVNLAELFLNNIDQSN
jgi:protein O-GlcNAc transferase